MVFAWLCVSVGGACFYILMGTKYPQWKVLTRTIVCVCVKMWREWDSVSKRVYVGVSLSLCRCVFAFWPLSFVAKALKDCELMHHRGNRLSDETSVNITADFFFLGQLCCSSNTFRLIDCNQFVSGRKSNITAPPGVRQCPETGLLVQSVALFWVNLNHS